MNVDCTYFNPVRDCSSVEMKYHIHHLHAVGMRPIKGCIPTACRNGEGNLIFYRATIPNGMPEKLRKSMPDIEVLKKLL
jgi:hypothetical protein